MPQRIPTLEEITASLGDDFRFWREPVAYDFFLARTPS